MSSDPRGIVRLGFVLVQPWVPLVLFNILSDLHADPKTSTIMTSEKRPSIEAAEDGKTMASNEVASIGGYVPGTEEEKKLVRKIDLYILPMMWFMYLLSYMDRTK